MLARRHHRVLAALPPANPAPARRLVDPFERSSRARSPRASISAAPTSLRTSGSTATRPRGGLPELADDDFRDYRLSVGGLVEHPMSLSLDELRALGEQSQITKHNCIQGWTAVAEWAGCRSPG